MDIGLDLILDTSMEPWFWNLPDKAMKERFKAFLRDDKKYMEITRCGRIGIMLDYVFAIDKLSEKKKVTWAYIGVNIDKYMKRCKDEDRILKRALKLYKESLE